MTAYFTNNQQFAISRMFSVVQRRNAWMIRKHPKLYHRRNGPRWVIMEQKALGFWEGAGGMYQVIVCSEERRIS